MAGQRLAAPGGARPVHPPLRTAGRAAGRVTRGVGFFLRPFGRVGGIVWLEVTGVFFGLFALVFAAAAYRTRPAGLHGPYDHKFLASAVLTALFAYLGASSFLRAGRK